MLSGPGSAVALAAVNRFTLARLEGYLAFFTALCTGSGKHLSGRLAGSFCIVPRRTTRLTAIEAPFRLVAITLGSEKFLLPRCKSEWVTAIDAIDLFVLVGHLAMFLRFIVGFSGHPACGWLSAKPLSAIVHRTPTRMQQGVSVQYILDFTGDKKLSR